MSSPTIAGADWLAVPALQRLLAALAQDGEEARIAGGAVRNALLGQPVADIDIATTNLPQETIRRAEAAGFKTIPTGIEHGTITAVADGVPYEVTTLRYDVETDGRHAVVEFGRDWTRDAQRRDFTMNALYADADGGVVDLVGGIADIGSRKVRFIGSAEDRIREDYLRILRFFRFFAWYGVGRPDAEGLKASARLKDGLSHLSAERVWSELKKTLSAPDPSRALLWMRQAGVLTAVLPESEKWGIDAIHGLIGAEAALGWEPDPLLRLEAIVPPDAVRMKALGERLKMSGKEVDRLVCWAMNGPVAPGTPDGELRKQLYYGDQQAIIDRLKLALASERAKAQDSDAALVSAGGFGRQLKLALTWSKPVFPIKGADLLEKGVVQGPQVGAKLAELERRWVESGFTLTRAQLLSVIGA